MKTLKELADYVDNQKGDLFDASFDILGAYLPPEFKASFRPPFEREYTELSVRRRISASVDRALIAAKKEDSYQVMFYRSAFMALTFALGHDKEFNWDYKDYCFRLFLHIKERYSE
jgi:hypothetical protein